MHYSKEEIPIESHFINIFILILIHLKVAIGPANL
jgi:hypothetical protein